MRFFVAGAEEISLSTIEIALKQVDAAYAITDRISGQREAGMLVYENGAYGQVEINRPGDGLFEEEIEEFREGAEEAASAGEARVLEVLEAAKAIVAVQVLFQERETEATLRRIDPLWLWLFENRGGLLQVDGEGWYDRSELIPKGG